MITRRHLKAASACVGSIALAIGVIFLVQYLSEEPQQHLLSHDAPPAGLRRGKIVLSLSSAMVILAAGPPGGPLRVESNFDPDVYTLGQHYQEGDDNGWTYRLDFHEKRLLHISVIGIWLGKQSPVVTVLIPPDLPFDLETTMKGGYLVMDFAKLALSSADVELNRGVLQVFVSDPMDVPMESLRVRSRIGTMRLDQVGNASPTRLDVHHRHGVAQLDLDGRWRADAEVDFRVTFATSELQLPDNVRIQGLGRPLELPSGREIPLPTLRIGAHSGFGNIRVIK